MCAPCRRWWNTDCPVIILSEKPEDGLRNINLPLNSLFWSLFLRWQAWPVMTTAQKNSKLFFACPNNGAENIKSRSEPIRKRQLLSWVPHRRIYVQKSQLFHNFSRAVVWWSVSVWETALFARVSLSSSWMIFSGTMSVIALQSWLTQVAACIMFLYLTLTMLSGALGAKLPRESKQVPGGKHSTFHITLIHRVCIPFITRRIILKEYSASSNSPMMPAHPLLLPTMELVSQLLSARYKNE